MRMFLLFVLLFVPVTSWANVDPEICFNIGNNETLCNNTAGCLYYPESNSYKCKQCRENSYCLATETQPRECPSPFTDSDLGATSENECYRDEPCYKPSGETEQCKYYYDRHIECTEISNPHMEGRTDPTCYADTRECRLFNSPNCNQDQITGTAEYSSSFSGGSMSGPQGYWDITNCACSSTDFIDNSVRFCHGQQNGTTPSAQSVLNATSVINYDTPTGGYHCTRCIHDNGNTKYYASSANGDGCTANLQSGVVCKCETSNNKGYWRSGTCNSDTNWTNATNICRRVACAPGQTTDEILPDDGSACHFGDETTLCDDAGCVKLKDIIEGISATQWTLIN